MFTDIPFHMFIYITRYGIHEISGDVSFFKATINQ